MILFVFEGNKREPQLFDSIQKLFFPKDNETIICSFGNNIYELYRQLHNMDGDGDIVSLLREKFKGSADDPFANVESSSDISEVFLFFDYDFHNINYDIEELNNRLHEMLEMFDNETENGKLYINYPMVESIRYTRELPDGDYYQYVVLRDECCRFKKIADSFSFYKSLDFICLPTRRDATDNEFVKSKTNWQILVRQNICKANYICNDKNTVPDTKEAVSQIHIFDNQLVKYVRHTPCCVSILNAFPLFIYEYF